MTCDQLLATLTDSGSDKALHTLASAVVALQKENADLRAALVHLHADVEKLKHPAREPAEVIKKALAEMG